MIIDFAKEDFIPVPTLKVEKVTLTQKCLTMTKCASALAG